MSLKILVVDDALFMRRMLRGILEQEGHTVVAEASDGEEAVARFREYAPDVTLMDIIMPHKNGIEALREITAFNPQARVVMCSAMGQEQLLRAAEAAGSRGFILKPFDPEQVKEMVRSVASG